jgi:hypothetical protein
VEGNIRKDGTVSENDLFPSGKPDDDTGMNTFFEQYKIAVELWDRLRAQRQVSNSFYVTINTALVGAIALKEVDPYFRLALCLAGLAVCLLWFVMLRFYRDLMDGKYHIISKIEALLPVAPFRSEMPYHHRFTSIERMIPLLFVLLASMHALL